MIDLEKCQLCKNDLKDNEFVVCLNCRNEYKLSEQENEFIDLFLKNSLEYYKDYERAILMSSSTEIVLRNARRILNNIIAEAYKDSASPMDNLAVALTYARMYATERPLAIEYFERWLKTPELPPKTKFKAYMECELYEPIDSYTPWRIYSIFANIYEREYQFEKAIQCLHKCIYYDNKSNYPDYIRIGNILVKIDINKAEEYYINLLNDNSLKQYEEHFSQALEEVREKKRNNYQYIY